MTVAEIKNLTPGDLVMVPSIIDEIGEVSKLLKTRLHVIWDSGKRTSHRFNHPICRHLVRAP